MFCSLNWWRFTEFSIFLVAVQLIVGCDVHSRILTSEVVGVDDFPRCAVKELLDSVLSVFVFDTEAAGSVCQYCDDVGDVVQRAIRVFDAELSDLHLSDTSSLREGKTDCARCGAMDIEASSARKIDCNTASPHHCIDITGLCHHDHDEPYCRCQHTRSVFRYEIQHTKPPMSSAQRGEIQLRSKHLHERYREAQSRNILGR
jgi:hypothetical protein